MLEHVTVTNVKLLLGTHFRQYPAGLKPARVNNEEMVFSVNFLSPSEQKNPSILTQFQFTDKRGSKSEEYKTRKTEIKAAFTGN